MATDDLVFLDAHCYLLNQASDFLLLPGGLASSMGNDVNPPQDRAGFREKGRCGVRNRRMGQYEWKTGRYLRMWQILVLGTAVMV